MKSTTQAIVFIRTRHVGSDAPTAIEQQITMQRVACQETARALNAVVIREYVEYGGTDRLERRPTVRQMLAELGQTRDVRYLITYGADRLARRTADFAEIEQTTSAAGVDLAFADNLTRKEA